LCLWATSTDPITQLGGLPLRGEMRIAYPPAATFADSDAQIAQMAQQLRDAGWSVGPGFPSHGTTLTKNNNGEIELFGECRDVTSTKDTENTWSRSFLA
jgi:hypothetical protein